MMSPSEAKWTSVQWAPTQNWTGPNFKNLSKFVDEYQINFQSERFKLYFLVLLKELSNIGFDI